MKGKEKTMTMCVQYVVIVFVLFTQAYSEDNLDTHIIFNEEDIEFDYDPYTNPSAWEGKAKRFYSLIHETMFENDRGTLNPNFVPTSPSIKHPVFVSKNIDEPDIKTKYIIYLPDKNEVAQQWRFSDGSKITAEDIRISLQYAICAGVVKDALIPYDNVVVRGNDVHISSPKNISKDIYISYLKKLYILPASCFGDFISQGCNCPNHENEIHGVRCDESGYEDDECISDWKDEETDITTSGSFKISEVMEDEQITLQTSNQVASRRKKSLDGFIVKVNSIRGMHATDYPKQVNLLIDVPASTISPEVKDFTNEIKMKPYTANLLWLNYSNRGKNSKHLVKLNFRKAIRLAINKEEIVKTVFSYNASVLTGPFSEHSEFYNHNVNEFRTTHKNNIQEAKNLLESIGYIFNEKKNRLEDPDGKPVELQLMYDASIDANEKDAITTSARKNLEEIGIIMTERAQENRGLFNSDKKRGPEKWDLCYDKILIRNPLEITRYYHSDPEFGNKNYSRYKNPYIEKALKTLESENDEEMKKIIAQRIHANLANDVASIYLWRLNSHSYYNNTQISKKNESSIDSEHFFLTPHQWEMIENEEE